jgi:hypothetical protein
MGFPRSPWHSPAPAQLPGLCHQWSGGESQCHLYARASSRRVFFSLKWWNISNNMGIYHGNIMEILSTYDDSWIYIYIIYIIYIYYIYIIYIQIWVHKWRFSKSWRYPVIRTFSHWNPWSLGILRHPQLGWGYYGWSRNPALKCVYDIMMLYRNWLVVWNMNFIFPYIGNNHPNWRTHMFQRGRSTTKQEICFCQCFLMGLWWFMTWYYGWSRNPALKCVFDTSLFLLTFLKWAYDIAITRKAWEPGKNVGNMTYTILETLSYLSNLWHCGWLQNPAPVGNYWC